ncbi:MAG: hypothetical protein V4439_00400 [Patescibacteria group bacterium]
MLRFIFPTILIGVAIAGFFMFVSPYYSDIGAMKDKVSSYNEALNNSKALESERDKLTAKYNQISTENMDKLQKLIPDNVDNIRLILEIEKIASPYGMVLKDVKYDTLDKTIAPAPTQAPVRPGALAPVNKDYGTWDLEFSTQGTYNNFINFIKDMESNLRIVDISSIQFSSDTGAGLGVAQSSGSYKYSFKIKTYWLKH